MNELRDAILQAAKADAIPAGTSGLWTVTKHTFTRPWDAIRNNKLIELLPGSYTYLHCQTEMTAMTPPGELVMHDTKDELNTHLEFMLRAWGRVLVTGLGLGCVVRGLLANPRVQRVTVIERSQNVLLLVGPHMPRTCRLEIVQGDAREAVKLVQAGEYECAYHDLWTCEDRGEPHLQVVHTELLCELGQQVKLQGAWGLPRHYRRLLNADANVI